MLLSNPGILLLGPLALIAPQATGKRRRRKAQGAAGLVLLLTLLLLGVALAHGAGFAPATAALPMPSTALQAGNETTISYSYDPLQRLTGAAYSSGGSFAYTYDGAGNRLTETVDGGTASSYSYDAANRLTAVDGQTYTYDANGNLLADGVYTYTYDSADRLVEVDDGVSTASYAYNGDGVRLAQIVDGLRTDYVQDVAGPLAQVLAATAGGTTTRYLHGLSLIGEQRGSEPTGWQYHLPDALGSVRQTVDAAANVTLRRSYGPFGGLRTAEGLDSAYGFAGEEQDATTGHVYLRARTYNPAAGRFLQQDRVLGAPVQPATLHRYAYAFNNPINVVDPGGRMPALNRSVNPANATVGSVTPFIAPARSVNNAGWATYSDPVARQQSVGFRPILCGVASTLFAGQQWLAENPETALGLAIIAGSVVATGGAAIPAILVGAAAGGLFGYGAQVVFNVIDPTINELDIFTHVNLSVIAQSAFHGAVSGAVGGVLSPMLNAVGTRGLTKVALMAAGEFVSGRAQQIAVNVATPGRDWHEDLFNPGRLNWWFDVGLDVIPGVTAASTKGAWRGARSLRYADDVSLRQFDEGLDARRTFAASCANSFVAGTLVQTEDGLVPIEDIEVGDRVLGEDPGTGEQGFFEVVAVTNHPTDKLLAVTMASVNDDGEDEGEAGENTNYDVMQITPEHPIYVEGEGWLLAENLELGDRLRRADGSMAKVLAIEQIRLDTPQPVYNFTVRGPHTYFVLDAGVLVHNALCPDEVREVFNQFEHKEITTIDLSNRARGVITSEARELVKRYRHEQAFIYTLYDAEVAEVLKVGMTTNLSSRSTFYSRVQGKFLIAQASYDTEYFTHLELNIMLGPNVKTRGALVDLERKVRAEFQSRGQILGWDNSYGTLPGGKQGTPFGPLQSYDKKVLGYNWDEIGNLIKHYDLKQMGLGHEIIRRPDWWRYRDSE